jgi:glycosyltransferase involved in cell wall biosynthesis
MVFSVIIPTKNRAGLLKNAIESVLSQTFQDWELVIVDDHSDDHTKEVVKSFNSGKIKYIRNTKSLGPGGSRNSGIKTVNVECRYISLLDDDDIYYPEFLQHTFDALKNTPDTVGFCWTGIENFYPANNRRQIFFWDPPYKNKEEAFDGFLEKRLIGTGYGITFKKSIFDKTGYFDENLRAVEDTDFFLRVLQNYYYVKIPQTLVRVTRHDTLHVNLDSADKAEALTAIYGKHREKILSNRNAWYNFKAKISSIYYRLGQNKKGREVLLNSFKERFSVKILLLLIRFELLRK